MDAAVQAARVEVVRGESKRDYIEDWLGRLENNYERGDACDLSLIGTRPSQSLVDSHLEFWDLTTRKQHKTHFFNALKNIFKKKKGDMSGSRCFSSRFGSVSEGNSEGDIGETRVSVVSSGKIVEDPFCLVDKGIRINRGYSEILHTKTYDIFSTDKPSDKSKEKEVDDKKEVEEKIIEEEIVENGWRENSVIIPQRSDNFSFKLFQLGHPELVQEKKNIIQVQEPPSFVPFKPYDSTGAPERKTSEKFSGQVSQRKELILRRVEDEDSYSKKIQLVKKYFDEISLKNHGSVERRPARFKPITPSVKKLTDVEQSKASVIDHRLSRDLTEVPYLREHERLQWQGRNKEPLFKISLIYNKYNGDCCSEELSKIVLGRPQQGERIPIKGVRLCPSKGDVKWPETRSNDKTSPKKTDRSLTGLESGVSTNNFWQGKREEINKEVYSKEHGGQYKCEENHSVFKVELPDCKIGERSHKGETQKKDTSLGQEVLENFFAKEKNVKMFGEARQEVKTEVGLTPSHLARPRRRFNGTRAWHEAVEQVRASMIRMSEEKRQDSKRFLNRTRSRTRVMESERAARLKSVMPKRRDLEEVSERASPSGEGLRHCLQRPHTRRGSAAVLKHQRPVPNLPCTPRFKYSFAQHHQGNQQLSQEMMGSRKYKSVC